MLNLTDHTWYRFLIWMVLGIVIYFTYGIRRSRLAGRERA
jgi:APA family basic amino acid/polyamine antiporter